MMNLNVTKEELRKASKNPWVLTPSLLVVIVPAKILLDHRLELLIDRRGNLVEALAKAD